MTTIGLLVCGAFSEKIMKKYEGDYEDFFINALKQANPDLSFKVFYAFKEQYPEDVSLCDGWLISGSKNGVYENLPWMLWMQDFIRQAYEQAIPMVGICFGHQIIGQALGGHVEKSTKGWGLGFSRYQLNEQLGEITGPSLDLYAIHQDQVVRLGPNAKVLASSDHCPHAVVKYENVALTFQPHPEFSVQFEQDLIESIAGDTIESTLAEKAVKGLANTKVHNREVMQVIADFFSGSR